jgi:peptidyl-prolyl cis-trans isomerase D
MRPAPFNHARAVGALFSAESIKSRQNTEAIEVQPGTLVAARVIEHQARPGCVRWPKCRRRSRRGCAPRRAPKLLAQKGEATSRRWPRARKPACAGLTFQVVGRQPSAALDAAGVKAVFRVNADKLPAYTGFARPDGSYRIVRVSRVLDAPTLDPMLLASIESGFMQAQQRADMKAMLALIKAGPEGENQAECDRGQISESVGSAKKNAP